MTAYAMSISQLVYLSQAVRKMSREEPLSIQEKPKKNNEPIDVTGSLFYNGGWFLQILERPLPMLDGLYKRIEADSRHTTAASSATNRRSSARSAAGA